MSARDQDKPAKRGQQPEALATFAEASRHGGKKPDDIGFEATRASGPLPGDLDQEEQAAAKVLNEGATGQNRGGKKAAKDLPDRTRTVRK
ncbi:MAG: hypothetical protein JOY67_23185 [Hyphomicrobiales bacterium]|nr:hypothetical protein [Hyphomicrobiales bacterium]MBV9115728.1 hypothetical protein [Hyphomicrobiales bacterium]MBV9519910.1 hypothetical protein [Hyphomicrobiales bacterium]